MRRNTLVMLAIAVVLLLAVGCSDDDGKTEAGGGTTASTKPLPAGEPIKLSVMNPVDGVAAQPES